MTFEKAARIAKCSLLPNRPYHVQWMLTRKCNYRCRGCNVWREKDIRELSTEEILKGLDILKELGAIDIVFSGGAPLLRDDITEILEYASQYFITTVYDNGSLAVEKIDALHYADFVAISLDTLDPKKNDWLKGVNGSLDKAIHAIQKLREKGINVSVSPTISQLNLHEIVDFAKYFLDRGIPLWPCLYSYDTPVESNQLFKIGRRNNYYKITDKEAMVKICDAFIALKKKNSNLLITTKILETVKQLFSDNKRIWKCRALGNFFMIDHLGRVAGCHLRGPVTSVFDLLEVWDTPMFDVLRKEYNKCTNCIYLCYIFYSVHGSVLGNLKIAGEQWKNARLFWKKNTVTSTSLAKTQ